MLNETLIGNCAKRVLTNVFFMSIEDEINIWVYFWCGSALIFLILWLLTQIKFNKKK